MNRLHQKTLLPLAIIFCGFILVFVATPVVADFDDASLPIHPLVFIAEDGQANLNLRNWLELKNLQLNTTSKFVLFNKLQQKLSNPNSFFELDIVPNEHKINILHKGNSIDKLFFLALYTDQKQQGWIPLKLSASRTAEERDLIYAYGVSELYLLGDFNNDHVLDQHDQVLVENFYSNLLETSEEIPVNNSDINRIDFDFDNLITANDIELFSGYFNGENSDYQYHLIKKDNLSNFKEFNALANDTFYKDEQSFTPVDFFLTGDLRYSSNVKLSLDEGKGRVEKQETNDGHYVIYPPEDLQLGESVTLLIEVQRERSIYDEVDDRILIIAPQKPVTYRFEIETEDINENFTPTTTPPPFFMDRDPKEKIINGDPREKR